MTRPDLVTALDELAQAAASTRDAARTTILAAAVVDLEHAAGAGLGAADDDPLVLLQRRLARVHRLLLDAPADIDAARVRRHADALRHPLPHPGPDSRRPDPAPSVAGAPLAARVLASCDAA